MDIETELIKISIQSTPRSFTIHKDRPSSHRSPVFFVSVDGKKLRERILRLLMGVHIVTKPVITPFGYILYYHGYKHWILKVFECFLALKLGYL